MKNQNFCLRPFNSLNLSTDGTLSPCCAFQINESTFKGEKNYNLNSYYGALKWDGRDMLGNHVANGVYFIRINYASSSNQSPGDNWTKLIVVK